MEKSAKRLSSIFSLGTSSSDKSNNNRNHHTAVSTHNSRTTSPSGHLQTSNSTLQPSASSPNLRLPTNGPSPRLSLSSDTTHPSSRNRHDALTPGVLKPLPLPPGSIRATRPASVASNRPTSPSKNFSRPMSSAGNTPTSPSTSSLRSTASSTEASRPRRPASIAGYSASNRPISPVKALQPSPTPIPDKRLSNRRSWLPSRSKEDSSETVKSGHQAPHTWSLLPDQQRPYNASSLLTFQKVPEIWHERGDTFIYLCSPAPGSGPSFRLDSSLFASSAKLSTLAHEATVNSSRQSAHDSSYRSFEEDAEQLSLNHPASRPRSPQYGNSGNGDSNELRALNDPYDESFRDVHLYLPLPLHADSPTASSTLDQDDIETLMAIRNLFAFLTGQPLVATTHTPTVFSTILKLADVLQRYTFSNMDGSTLGEEVAGYFARFVEDFKLGDVRGSREKTIQAIVLGERMRYWPLYNEGFVHAVGKYEDIASLRSTKFALISSSTRKRLERSTLDLNTRLKNIHSRLETFDFPSLFAGIANSSTSSESKVIRFKAWKTSFVAMRKHILTFYREKYGAWPPKARSKKNDFEESGLNRILLQELYQDFSDLYDVLVDRSSITTRSIDVPSHVSSIPEDGQRPASSALRRVMSEYDRSTPPVQPPMPLDTPLLPSLSATRRNFQTLDMGRQKRENAKRLRDDEINQALMHSYNRDSIKSTPFLESFMSFERKSSHGCSMDEIFDLRHGQWIFLYAVLQALPLVVVDAPGLKWTDGVEYFLCEVPKGVAPWIHEKSSIKQSWYGVAGGAGVVSLPADVVDHGVDGIYRRSHAWQAAEQWAGNQYDAAAPIEREDLYDGLEPPHLQAAYESAPGSRNSSPSRRSQRDSVSLGLEALPLPANVAPSGARPLSIYDPGKSFDDILGTMQPPGGKRKK